MSKPNEVRLRNISTKEIILTAAAIALSSFRHGGLRGVNCNLAAGQAITLPAATGKKGKFRLITGITVTGSTTIHTAGSDVFTGVVNMSGSTSGTFGAASNSNTITFNGSTTGGLVGSYVELEDIAPGKWRVHGEITASGTAATPFSNS